MTDMDGTGGYLAGAALWLMLGALCAYLNARQAARLDRALSLKYPRANVSRTLRSRVGFALLYVVAGPYGIQAVLMSNRRALVGDRPWEAAR